MNDVQKLESRTANNYMWSDHWAQLKRTFRFEIVHSLPYPPKYQEKLSNEYVTHERNLQLCQGSNWSSKILHYNKKIEE